MTHKHTLYEHHFPSRRSSDLDPGVTREVGLREVEPVGAVLALALDPVVVGLTAPRGRGLGAGRDAEQVDEVDERLQRDRKSTRLNSSHPSYSYADFCLKKITS